MRKLLYILLALPLACCQRWEPPLFGDDRVLPNVTIGDLRAYYDGAELRIADDIVIAGRVVSSDRAGNFYNTFFIDDGTGAAEIMAGIADLDAVYHPGQMVSVRARGLAVGWRDGVMQLGLAPEAGNRYPTGYFYHRVVIGRHVFPKRDVEPPAPLRVKIADLRAEMCGRLVRIDALRADPLTEAANWAASRPQPVTGHVKFRSTTTTGVLAADSITVVTSGYASWADAPLPRGEITLTGILLRGKGDGGKDHYLLKLRDEKDIVDL